MEGPATRRRLWFQKHVVAGRSPLLDDAYEQRLANLLLPDSELEIHTLPAESYGGRLPAEYVKTGQAEAAFAFHFAATSVVAERRGFDAYLIGTSQDPGLESARALASIPVLGYGQTAFGFCALRHLRFGVVGFIAELAEVLGDNIHRYGFDRWYAGPRPLEGAGGSIERALAGDAAPLMRAFEAAAAELADRGAHVIVPGEGVPNELLRMQGVTRVAGLPVLDANALLVRTGELMVDVHGLDILEHPDVGYAHRRLPPGELDRLLALFGPRSLDGQFEPG